MRACGSASLPCYCCWRGCLRGDAAAWQAEGQRRRVLSPDVALLSAALGASAVPVARGFSRCDGVCSTPSQPLVHVNAQPGHGGGSLWLTSHTGHDMHTNKRRLLCPACWLQVRTLAEMAQYLLSLEGVPAEVSAAWKDIV